MSTLTGQAQAALLSLHGKATRTADNFEMERIDRALDEIERDTDRDKFMSAEEAMKYGLVDKVLEHMTPPPPRAEMPVSASTDGVCV